MIKFCLLVTGKLLISMICVQLGLFFDQMHYMVVELWNLRGV